MKEILGVNKNVFYLSLVLVNFSAVFSEVLFGQNLGLILLFLLEPFLSLFLI